MKMAWLSMCLVTMVACGSEVDGTGAGGGGSTTATTGSGATLPEPARHRAAAETCTGTPPPGNPIPDDTGQCMADGDCTDGVNGRCIWPFGGTNVCRYDECSTDAECGTASVCTCRLEEGFDMNRCFRGNCLVDADCGEGGWCSPSAVHLPPTCFTGIAPGSIGYFCRTEADTCLDDSDCGGQGEAACLFDVDQLAWICQDLLCFN